MPNTKNKQQVDQIKDKLSKAKSMAIVDYSGSTVNDLTKLRSELKEAGGEMFVTKNTLIDIALGRGRVKESLSGMNALVVSYEDAVSALKALFTFHKDTEKLVIKEGWMNEDDKVLSADQVKALSELPSKDELIAKLMQILKSPAQGVVNVVKAGPRDLVYALKAIADEKSE